MEKNIVNNASRFVLFCTYCLIDRLSNSSDVSWYDGRIAIKWKFLKTIDLIYWILFFMTYAVHDHSLKTAQ